MNPAQITQVFRLALEARSKRKIWNPMFVSEAGLGKSSIVQQNAERENREELERNGKLEEWDALLAEVEGGVELTRHTEIYKRLNELRVDFGFQFIDLRLAYYEGPDFVGLPYNYKDDSGRDRMGHALPHFWPTKGKGIVFLEEPNRGNTMIQNCLMQLLTDRSVGPNYVLPEGFIIIGAMNPATQDYDVQDMDTALKDRFEFFEVEYSYTVFKKYANSKKWHPRVLNFINSGNWVYKKQEAIGENSKYISPRTFSKLNAAEIAGGPNGIENLAFHRIVCESILGREIGAEYYASCHDKAPVLAKDIISDTKAAFKRLKGFCDPASYQADVLRVTTDDIEKNYDGWYKGRQRKDANGNMVDWPAEEGKLNEQQLIDVINIIPADMGVALLVECGINTNGGMKAQEYLAGICKRHPDMKKYLKENLKLNR